MHDQSQFLSAFPAHLHRSESAAFFLAAAQHAYLCEPGHASSLPIPFDVPNPTALFSYVFLDT